MYNNRSEEGEVIDLSIALRQYVISMQRARRIINERMRMPSAMPDGLSLIAAAAYGFFVLNADGADGLAVEDWACLVREYAAHNGVDLDTFGTNEESLTLAIISIARMYWGNEQ
jgi:hypothetical protein